MMCRVIPTRFPLGGGNDVLWNMVIPDTTPVIPDLIGDRVDEPGP